MNEQDKPLVLPARMIFLAELRQETIGGETYFKRAKQQLAALIAMRRRSGRKKKPSR